MRAHGEVHDRAAALLDLHALRALPPDEAAFVEAHALRCADCSWGLSSSRSLVDVLVAWPVDVLRPSASLWDRVASRIASQDDANVRPLRRAAEPRPDEQGWDRPGPGIECKILAADAERERVTMLVRLAPGASYPPHRHAGTEELFLLDGELWIEDRKLVPGDFSRAEAGTEDRRVWSETGCTCVLVTSSLDELR